MATKAEKETSIHFGLVGESQAAGMPRATASSDVQVTIYGSDLEWREGAIGAQSQANHAHPGTAKPVPTMRELIGRIDEAKSAGEVPISIEGPSDEISGFLQRAGLTEVELIPPHL